MNQDRAKDVVGLIVRRNGDKALLQQFEHCKITSADEESPMIMNIKISTEYLPKSVLPDGPILPGWWCKYKKNGEDIGFILVFIKDGVLSWVEAPWTSDDMPSEWPRLEEVYFEKDK